MALKQVMEMIDLLDSAYVNGQAVKDYFAKTYGCSSEVVTVRGEKGSTDFVKFTIPGVQGKSTGGSARTLGVVGRLGGIGARPDTIGLVSDGDGAVAALATAAALCNSKAKGDQLPGDVMIATHICPYAPTRPHTPVPFMDSPVDMMTMNQHEVGAGMDAILSVDTTRGNRLLNHRGIAITPTAKQGYVLKVSDDLLDIMQIVTGELPYVLPITTQDITPYGNGVYHINSLMQPTVSAAAPVVGVAITTQTAVPGCATGACHEQDVALAVRFCVETAKQFGAGKAQFYDSQEFEMLTRLYGELKHLQTLGG